MASERDIVCGGLSPPATKSRRSPVLLNLWGNKATVSLKIGDISDRMVANVPPILLDLLEVATYVYCADQATTRGGTRALDHGAKWRRHFHFHVPVRKPAVWSSSPVCSALRDTLGFLSDDEYDFRFQRLTNAPPVAQYLDFSPGEAVGFDADEVVLFSGGLDSLGGAVEEAVEGGRRVALVSHRSAPKIDRRQKTLRLCPSPPFHVPVWVNKDKALGKEFTQRTRSFLYACLATVVARLFGLRRIRFFENGVVSINLPLSAQVLGGRATRTTHPQVINGFSDLLSAILQEEFIVENPFLWKTKAEVVRAIRAAGCGELIKHAVSCNHVWQSTRLKTHCGMCSQCIDRRFATLSAGCPDEEDPEEMYAVDLLCGEREVGESRTMVESYVRAARRVRDMTDVAFFSEFGEVHRVTRHVKETGADETASRMLDLYRRHAGDVCRVLDEGVRRYAQDMNDGKLPSSCVLILALPQEYKRPETFAEAPVLPLLILEDVDEERRRTACVAQLVGHGAFEGLRKSVGAREVFFLNLLCGARREHNVAGERIAVVAENECVRQLREWSEAGYLTFGGRDRANPTHRVTKMWREFVRQMEKERSLKGLFTSAHRDREGEKLYALRRCPQETQNLLASIPALFRPPR